MYQNFLLELKNQREARGCSVDDLSKETKISKKVIFKIENLSESEVDSFPQRHLLFLYAKHLGVEVPEKKFTLTHPSIENSSKFSNNLSAANSNLSLINNFKFQILLSLFLVIIILSFNYSLKNNNLSVELKLDNTEIISQNDLENNLAENRIANFNQTNIEKLNPSISNSKRSASLSDNKQNFLETVSLSILFDNEVWIEVDNSKEVLISQVFKEGEELNLEVSKNDEIFVTSGNMGLISIKVNNGQIKFLGSIGEIGRKQIF
jgi:cytoskeletal protein RodZ